MISTSNTPQQSHGTAPNISDQSLLDAVGFHGKTHCTRKTGRTCRLSKCVSELLKGSVLTGNKFATFGNTSVYTAAFKQQANALFLAVLFFSLF